MKPTLALLTLLLALPSLGEPPYIHQIPDFTQTEVRGRNSGGGQQYCAPVAVSNSLFWLYQGQGRQLELIHRLASKDYMNTSLRDGTGTTGVLRGVDRMARELFGDYRVLDYEGWRKHPKRFSSGVQRPDLERLKSWIAPKTAAWINVGWYVHDPEKNEYRRIGGHWVTLVGAQGDQLILHDPAPRAGETFANEFVELAVIPKGRLVGKKAGLPTSAKGYLRLGQGMHLKKGATTAVIDGVVYFKR